MNSRAQIRVLPDGHRLHMHDGPIDLILQAFGTRFEVESAYQAASRRFVTVLDELCRELRLLRQQWCENLVLQGPIACRMLGAVAPYGSSTFITPMAAVAGAVAEEILHAMTSSAELSKAYVNDGGDIALYLAPGEEFSIGMVGRPDQPSLFGASQICSSDGIQGIATSGWRGRSFSLGIADAVTVLARTAAEADAAATMIANTVDLPGNSKISRVPACELAPDSDLGMLLVTQSVAPLTAFEVHCALQAGVQYANDLFRRDLIISSALHLQGRTEIAGTAEFLSNDARARRNLLHA